MSIESSFVARDQTEAEGHPEDRAIHGDEILDHKTIIELRHGDCVVGMAGLAAESVDIVVTSPPYNLGIEYSKCRDDQPRDQYLAWCGQWSHEIKRVLKPDGSVFVVVGSAPKNPLLPHELALELSRILVLQNEIAWIKAVTLDGEDGETISRGHFKPINSRRFLNDCRETVMHFTKTGDVTIDRLAIGVPYGDKSNVARWGHTGGHDRRCRGNVWFVPYETIQSHDRQRPHPATFPVKLAEMCIKLHGGHDDTVVLDPFVGIGSSALAAQACGVGKFIGFDIDDHYLAVAAERTGATVVSVPKFNTTNQFTK